jgi:hypothetical protein
MIRESAVQLSLTANLSIMPYGLFFLTYNFFFLFIQLIPKRVLIIIEGMQGARAEAVRAKQGESSDHRDKGALYGGSLTDEFHQMLHRRAAHGKFFAGDRG